MNLRKPQYLTIVAIYLDESKTSLADQLKELPGTWDVINLDGTLTTISNTYDKEDLFYSDSFIRIAYVKSLKHNTVDNRTYKQVDSMEAYIRYKLLKNPFLYICDSNIFTEYTMGVDLEDLAKEIGISNRNLMFKYNESK
jgi:hypothetical protein